MASAKENTSNTAPKKKSAPAKKQVAVAIKKKTSAAPAEEKRPRGRETTIPNKKRSTIDFTKEILAAIDKKVGKRGRSPYVRSVVIKDLESDGKTKIKKHC